jgi:predicted Zn-dependent protease
MIDYDKPDEDAIVAEVRRARVEFAAEHGYDLRAMFEFLRRHEATSGRTYSDRVPQPLSPTPAPAKKVG